MKIEPKHPKVSIVSITYNQEDFVRDMLNGFIAQETKFDFEIIIADDCSTDKTANIIMSYAKKYPKLFRPILREKNMGAIPNLMDAMKKANGEYVALCEGDDYWTDPRKLQKQVEFMDKNPSYALSFHPVEVIFEDTKENSIFPSRVDKFDTKDLLTENFMQTNSVMYKKQDYEHLADNVMPGDLYLHLYHAQFGRIGFINDVMSVYRRHSKGLWWSLEGDGSIWRKYLIGFMFLYENLLNIYGENKEYEKIILSNIEDILQAQLELPEKVQADTFKRLSSQFPIIMDKILVYQVKTNRDYSAKIKTLEREFDIYKMREKEYLKEINGIKSSKAWKAITMYRKTKDKLAKKAV